MRRILAAALAAVIIPFGGVSVANADPSSGSDIRCTGFLHVAPDINVNTCTYYYWWMYGENWSHRARITVANTSPTYPVYVTPELQVDSAVYVSAMVSIPPGTTQEVLGDYVEGLPGHVRKTGRAYLQERNWWTRTYAPSYP